MVNKSIKKEINNMNNILIVGGNFDNTRRPSSLVTKLYDNIALYCDHNRDKIDINEIKCKNGGTFEELEAIAGNKNPNYDLNKFNIVFWFPNIEDNNLPKLRDLKSINPKIMLINSKRNDNNKYSFQEMIQRSLAVKANLTFEFSKNQNNYYNIRVFDPLGCIYADTASIAMAAKATLDRLAFIIKITRQPTTQASDDKNLILKWYFDQFKQPEYQSDKNIQTPDEQKFIDIVKHYAHKFQEFMPHDCKTERFVGNASFKPTPRNGRCGKGMPSFKYFDEKSNREYIFVSKRNIDKQFIELDNFVPVYLEDNKLYYCGNDKPSVDTPVQVRLYKELPQIRYMLHSHCYLEDAPYTFTAIPCGAIEEVDEVLKTIDTYYNNRNMEIYRLNMIGHGSIVMTSDLKYFENLKYKARILPEKVN